MPAHLWPAYLLRLAAGILAIQSHSVPIPTARAVAYAGAAVSSGIARGEDPYELIGVARNESDFVEDIISADGKDCGLTQTRVTTTRYSCDQLRHDARLSFAEGARELSEWRRTCRGVDDYDRCRFNRYNAGMRYPRTGVHGNYYLRVLCYAEAARAIVDPGTACVRVTQRGQIARLIERLRRGQSDAAVAAMAPARTSPLAMRFAAWTQRPTRMQRWRRWPERALAARALAARLIIGAR